MIVPVYQAAGIRTLDEAEMLIRAGFNFIGFPLRLDFHSPDVSESEAKTIIEQINAVAVTVLITYLQTSDEIVSLAEYLGVRAVQIHGDIELNEIKSLRDGSPELIIIKSLVIRDDNAHYLKNLIDRYHTFVDYFITDTFDKESGASGATGKTHDWAISRELREYSPKPLILAGGLNPDNVTDAINTVRPYGVDVHTGIENISGDKDQIRSQEFIANARFAFGA
jgi:phosphoribosylanthranilate isomerase